MHVKIYTNHTTYYTLLRNIDTILLVMMSLLIRDNENANSKLPLFYDLRGKFGLVWFDFAEF